MFLIESMTKDYSVFNSFQFAEEFFQQGTNLKKKLGILQIIQY